MQILNGEHGLCAYCTVQYNEHGYRRTYCTQITYSKNVPLIFGMKGCGGGVEGDGRQPRVLQFLLLHLNHESLKICWGQAPHGYKHTLMFGYTGSHMV